MTWCGPNRATSPAGEPCAEQAADAGRGEREAVLPRCEPETAEHEDSEQRLGRHDQAVDGEGVEEQRAQPGVGQDVAPAVEQVAGAQPRRVGPLRQRLVPADGQDPDGRQQVAERIADHGRHRAEQPDRGPAERRAERGRAPGRGLEPRVRHEQVLGPDQRLQVGAAGRAEGDLGRGHDDRDDEELGEAEPAERERDRDAQHAPRTGSGPSPPSPAACGGTPPTGRAAPRPPRPRPARPRPAPRPRAVPACSTRIAIRGNAPNPNPEP